MTSDTQNTAPERIWLDVEYASEGWTWDENDVFPNDVPYLRTDLHERIVAEAVAAALEEAINRVNGCDRVSEVQPAIRALIKDPSILAKRDAQVMREAAEMILSAPLANGESRLLLVGAEARGFGMGISAAEAALLARAAEIEKGEG
jgi:hypothetical protein